MFKANRSFCAGIIVLGLSLGWTAEAGFRGRSTRPMAYRQHMIRTIRPLTPPLSPCDFNGDRNINVLDLQLMINEILADGNNPRFDIVDDGDVNVIDLQVLANVILGSFECPE